MTVATEPRTSTCTVPLTDWFAGGVKEAAIEPPIMTVATEPRTSVCTVPLTDWLAVEEVRIDPPTITTGACPMTDAPTVPDTLWFATGEPTVITEAFVLVFRFTGKKPDNGGETGRGLDVDATAPPTKTLAGGAPMMEAPTVPDTD